jgi:GNAT superfamily N-acetyltransferase
VKGAILMKKELLIRAFQPDDCQGLVPLYDQLGYPVDVATLAHRLPTMLTKEDYHLLVATMNDQIIGFIGFVQMKMFEADEDYIRILVLVVDETSRRQGIAQALLNRVKFFAKQKDIRNLAVNSGITSEREAAHAFYENEGFIKVSFGFKCQI